MKKTTFPASDPDHVFGYAPEKDPEGVREGEKLLVTKRVLRLFFCCPNKALTPCWMSTVTGIWKEHQRSLGHTVDAHGKPHADFKAMNKLAAIR